MIKNCLSYKTSSSRLPSCNPIIQSTTSRLFTIRRTTLWSQSWSRLTQSQVSSAGGASHIPRRSAATYYTASLEGSRPCMISMLSIAASARRMSIALASRQNSTTLLAPWSSWPSKSLSEQAGFTSKTISHHQRASQNHHNTVRLLISGV